MTDIAAMRVYLRDVIGLLDETGPNPGSRREAVQEEGLSVITDFVDFDDESIKVLCSSIRKPGGTIPDPANNANRIPNPGHSIPAICEKRLKQAAYGARLYDSIGRAIENTSLTRNRLKLFQEHRDITDNHKEPEKLPVVSKTFPIMKAMDLVPNHLRDRLGVEKVSLAYVIREDSEPTAEEALVNGRITSIGFTSLMEELIDRTPHTGIAFVEDNAKVFSILQDMVAGTPYESSLKAHQRARDGRNAYLSLCKHNLGSAKWDKIIEDAESYILRREWNGRNYRFSLKAHIAKHRDAHNDMQKASQFITYQVPDDHTRVGRLIKSITSKDPSVMAAITHILGTPTLRDDFEEAADFLLLTQVTQQGNQSSQRISATRTGKKYQSAGTGKTGVEFWYHTANEFRRLSKEQIEELKDWRAKTKREKKDSEQKVMSLETKFESILKQNEEMSLKIVALLQQQSQAQSTRQPLEHSLTQRTN